MYSCLPIGFLRKANQYDILYKPVQAGSKGPREVMFYEGLFDPPEESLPRDLQRLKKLIPGYYGVCDIADRAGETCILLRLCGGCGVSLPRLPPQFFNVFYGGAHTCSLGTVLIIIRAGCTSYSLYTESWHDIVLGKKQTIGDAFIK
jgi:hypothetical protein